MSAVLNFLIRRREAGIFVMIVLFCLFVGVQKPQFLTLDSLRIVLLLTPLIMIGALSATSGSCGFCGLFWSWFWS